MAEHGAIAAVRRRWTLRLATAAVLVAGAAAGGLAADKQPIVGLVTKTEVNPFFVKMRQAAAAEAKAKGVQLIARAGKFDGDNEGQVTAMEALISAGAKGILVTPSNSTGVLDVIKKARDAGILVIALDTATDPRRRGGRYVRHRQFPGRRAAGRYAEGGTRQQDAEARHAGRNSRRHGGHLPA